MTLAALAASATAQTQWLALEHPAERASPAGAYDSDRQRLVVFGGTPNITTTNPLPYFDDTWEWDGSSWQRRQVAVAPRARTGHAMAYDAARHRVVLFGGNVQASPYVMADTWEWDGRAWTQRAPPAAPSARSGHRMAFDGARRRVVLFGGYAPGLMQDTWEWDGTTWLQRTPATTQPPPRSRHDLVYDALRQRIVLFGGTIGNWVYADDTWEWDGNDWSQRAVGPLRARADHAMAYDSIRGRTVLYGGGDRDAWWDDCWEWDGSSWTAVATGPEGRTSHLMAFDAARGVTLAFAGYYFRDDLWSFDGVAWREASNPRRPGYRADHAVTFDGNLQRVMLFGGFRTYSPGPVLFDDTWSFDGVHWIEHTTARRPPARASHALAYDSVRRATVLFGGDTRDDTWLFDGTDWSEVQPAAKPPARNGHSMAFDERRQQVVLFGGNVGQTAYADTWTWDGTTWTLRNPPLRPPVRTDAAMTYDAQRERIVLFGGYDPRTAAVLGDTWEWDGTTWLQRVTAVRPLPRLQHAMTYDSRRQRVILCGGMAADDTWEWDGSAWTQPATGIVPSGRWQHGIAYDPIQDRTVLVGSLKYHTTWLYGALTPAQATVIGTGCAGVAGIPSLVGNRPFLGNFAFHLDLVGAAPQSPCLFGLSLGTQSLQLGGGCTLYLADVPLAFPLVTDVTGFATVRLPLFLIPALRGFNLYAQAAVADAAASLGLAFTSGLRLTLGD